MLGYRRLHLSGILALHCIFNVFEWADTAMHSHPMLEVDVEEGGGC